MESNIVFFDLGNTLVKLKRALIEYCVMIIALEIGKRLDSITEIDQAIARFKRAELDEWNAIPVEKINYVKNDQQEFEFWKNFYKSVLIRLGCSSPTNELIDSLAEIPMDPTSFDLFDDVQETLERLKQQGAVMGIISNAFPSANRIIEHLELARWFQYIILSHEHEILPKPHPQIYEFAIKQTKIDYNSNPSILFIDDRMHFVEGANNANVGISGILIDRDLSAPEVLCKRISDLRQIPESFSCLSHQGTSFRPCFA